MEQRRNERAGKTGDPRENPPSSSIGRNNSHVRKSGGDPAGNRTLFAWVGATAIECCRRGEACTAAAGGGTRMCAAGPPRALTSGRADRRPRLASPSHFPVLVAWTATRGDHWTAPKDTPQPPRRRHSTACLPTPGCAAARPPAGAPPLYVVQVAEAAERLACSPPTIANRVQSLAGSLRIFACGTMPLVGGFSRESPVSPALSFQRCSILTSITHVGSQNLAVKSRPNLFTYSLFTFFCSVSPVFLRTRAGEEWSGRPRPRQRDADLAPDGASCPQHGCRAPGCLQPSRPRPTTTRCAGYGTGSRHALHHRLNMSEEIWATLNSEVLRADEGGGEMDMEQRRTEEAGKTTIGIFRHDSHLRKFGVNRPGIEPISPWWEASGLTAQPPWPQCVSLKDDGRRGKGKLRNLRLSSGLFARVEPLKKP
ncbi:hypothetical protein PR048_028883 [Dryococelus australis]|uniref:Uncharacterized protein n=1 Tax=Dryococelus australis TaxID=614101 RepID=A0ABQ9GBS8_9NEOP|nr:hypothetical protein PR048_028883 [Dryococelus australis]